MRQRFDSFQLAPFRSRSRGRATLRLIAVLVSASCAFLVGFLWSDAGGPGSARIRSGIDRARRLVDAGPEDERPAGRWRRSRGPVEHAPTTQAGDELEALRSIGYMTGYEPPSGAEGVIVNVANAVQTGLNLYTSGHAQAAFLMDLDGRVLHRWSYEFEAALPELKAPAGAEYTRYWRRAHLYPNGDLLAIYEGAGMLKVDRNSNLLWSIGRGCHHDMCVDDAGQIWVLTRRAHVLPRFHPDRAILEDYVSVYDAGGSEVRHVSILEAFERSSFASTLARCPEYGDLLHTNTIEWLDGRHVELHPAFRAGNVLLSMLKTDTIAVLDMEREEIVWALSGQWRAQHQPTFLKDGNLLLLDNQGHQGWSKVIEFDPLSQEIAWSYEGSPENGFFTHACGSCQRLDNGNTLITESDSGRAFEVQPDGTIVWEYVSPERGGDDSDLIATLFEVVRVDPADVAWLAADD